MIKIKTAIDMPNVVLGSAVGTDRKWLTPNNDNTVGNRSTGSKSIKFIKNTQTKIVSAKGAINWLTPWKDSFTVLSTNSTRISTKFWILPGTPLLTVAATQRNKIKNPICREYKKEMSETYQKEKRKEMSEGHTIQWRLQGPCWHRHQSP